MSEDNLFNFDGYRSDDEQQDNTNNTGSINKSEDFQQNPSQINSLGQLQIGNLEIQNQKPQSSIATQRHKLLNTSIFKHDPDEKQKDKKEKKSSFSLSLLGKRTDRARGYESSSESSNSQGEEQNFDLMKRARKQIQTLGMQEFVNKAKLKQQNSDAQDLQKEKVNQKLSNIDPVAQKLFSMLPAAKSLSRAQGGNSGGSQTISGAIKNDLRINFVAVESDEEINNEELKLDEDQLDIDEKNLMTEIKGDELLNKEQFMRNQLKKHSIQMYRNQTMERMQQFETTTGRLAKQGKGKNHLAAMANEDLDNLAEDKGSVNLQEYRMKKSRYGW